MNFVTPIPKTPFVDFESLEQLDLSHNQLTKTDHNFFNGLKNLVRLYIGDNQITTIEDGAFDNLSELVVVGLNNNKLQKVPTIKNAKFK